MAQAVSEVAAPLEPYVSSINDTKIVVGRDISSLPAYWRGALDDVRLYDRKLSTAEIQKLYQMGTPIGSSTALPQGCPNIGDVCDDGTIYAGDSPDGTIPMFAAPEDEEGTFTWGDNGLLGLSADDGDGNTETLAALGEAAHPAAYACYNKNTIGYDDWYLPARNEMDNDNLNNGGNEIGGLLADAYWSSSENDASTAWGRDFNVDNNTNRSRGNALRVRCVRKGPAPRCANPYGLEGEMIYNSTHDVVQYCDGARWRAIGK